ncbi:hypothetical protein GQ53DRAFT_752237 [Thozetella sp. PMI_491]|nr:hypothetical protein GQ53DRAFT_752237 [Thozetella sp. PMI_491]
MIVPPVAALASLGKGMTVVARNASGTYGTPFSPSATATGAANPFPPPSFADATDADFGVSSYHGPDVVAETALGILAIITAVSLSMVIIGIMWLRCFRDRWVGEKMQRRGISRMLCL